MPSPAALLSLQRSAGNAAVTRMVRHERDTAGAGGGLSGRRPGAATPTVQRVPSDGERRDGPAEPRSVFESDSESDSESGTASVATVTPQDDVLPYHRDLRALRALIRRAIDAENSPGAHEDGSGGKEKSPGRRWIVTAKIDPGASWTSRDFRDGEVGHVWLELISPLGQSTQFGFYPKTPAGVGSVPGEILCPDPHRGDTERKTAAVGLQDVLSGYRAAFSRANAKYHLAGYNCASFASDVWEAMTGRPLPNGLLLANPASAAESVRTERRLRASFAGEQMSGELEEMIDMISSGRVPPAL